MNSGTERVLEEGSMDHGIIHPLEQFGTGRGLGERSRERQEE